MKKGDKVRSKIAVINKYKEPRKVEVLLTSAERRANGRGSSKTHKEIEEPHYYCRQDEDLTVVSENNIEMLIVENLTGDRFAIRLENVK